MASAWAEVCAREGKSCTGWVQRYFSDCLCSARDDVSFALGILSLAFWAVAEVPQLVTNFKNKSGQGVSLALLLTWVVGDIFNLVGCVLEPVTLPTQLYTALLYTVVTVVLVIQTLYYDYFLKWWKCKGRRTGRGEDDDDQRADSDDCNSSSNSSTVPIPTTNTTIATRWDTYITSARSLANSGTPPFQSPSSRSYLRADVVKSGPPVEAAALLLHDHSSSEDEADEGRPPRPHGDAAAATRGPPRHGWRGRVGAISRSAGYGTFLSAAINFPSQTKGLIVEEHVLIVGRKLLMETSENGSTVGVWLGWIMAAIYMGGRLPQIVLNIKRGSVDGLNPLMFIFALLANATYVGSILVRSVEWRRIKANAPWLIDAIVCVLLDLLIIAQYGYYKFMERRRIRNDEDDYGCYYIDPEKPQP